MRISLKNESGFTWFCKNGVNVRGFFYWRGEYFENEKMLNVFQNITSKEHFVDLLNEINGYYAVVIVREAFLLAATDRINSTPLFFAHEDELLLSDDARYVITDDVVEDHTSMYEYLLLGYTTGNNTVYNNIKQLKPGECLYYELNTNSITLNRYYEYIHSSSPYDIPEDELVDKLNEVHEKVFKRFVDSLKGKKVIIPLSGGYDSRLIVEMLRKYDYDNVLCITWGKKNDWQVKIAKDVAKRLNYQWIRVDHTRKDWYEWFRSEKYSNINNITGYISSIPYLQENISIEYLEEEYKIPKNSIFVSGNSGDFIEGEHIPEEFLKKEYFSSKEIVELIFRKHHRLFKLKNQNHEDEVKKRIFDIIGTENEIDSELAASIFENWEWQERQSKFVSKSIKAFEAKGYEWRLPLWDSEIMDFWSRVPLKYRYGRQLFFKYSDKYMMKNVADANPRINKLKIYMERLFDNRYGCFNGNYTTLRSLFIKDEEVFSKSLMELVENKYLILHKLNGLIALWNIKSMKTKIGNEKDTRSFK